MLLSFHVATVSYCIIVLYYNTRQSCIIIHNTATCMKSRRALTLWLCHERLLKYTICYFIYLVALYTDFLCASNILNFTKFYILIFHDLLYTSSPVRIQIIASSRRGICFCKLCSTASFRSGQRPLGNIFCLSDSPTSW